MSRTDILLQLQEHTIDKMASLLAEAFPHLQGPVADLRRQYQQERDVLMRTYDDNALAGHGYAETLERLIARNGYRKDVTRYYGTGTPLTSAVMVRLVSEYRQALWDDTTLLGQAMAVAWNSAPSLPERYQDWSTGVYQHSRNPSLFPKRCYTLVLKLTMHGGVVHYLRLNFPSPGQGYDETTCPPYDVLTLLPWEPTEAVRHQHVKMFGIEALLREINLALLGVLRATFEEFPTLAPVTVTHLQETLAQDTDSHQIPLEGLVVLNTEDWTVNHPLGPVEWRHLSSVLQHRYLEQLDRW